MDVFKSLVVHTTAQPNHFTRPSCITSNKQKTIFNSALYRPSYLSGVMHHDLPLTWGVYICGYGYSPRAIVLCLPSILYSFCLFSSANASLWLENSFDELLTGETKEGNELRVMTRLWVTLDTCCWWCFAVRCTKGAQAMQMPKIISIELLMEFRDMSRL